MPGGRFLIQQSAASYHEGPTHSTRNNIICHEGTASRNETPPHSNYDEGAVLCNAGSASSHESAASRYEGATSCEEGAIPPQVNGDASCDWGAP